MIKTIWGIAAIVLVFEACGSGNPSLTQSAGPDNSGDVGGTSGRGSTAQPGLGGSLSPGEGGEGNPAIESCTTPDGVTCVYEVPDPGPICGDGHIDAERGETCDDGNVQPGDGCSGVCSVEPNYRCDSAGCISTIRCGDGERTSNEGCDDGNTASSDGCSDRCKVESGWYCSEPGQPCTRLTACGDGRISLGEGCDDGNRVADDGCDNDCRVAVGYRCLRPGVLCQPVPECGDGKLAAVAGEQCDDGNTADRDGCSSKCRIEASYFDCSTPGRLCTSRVKCGDGKLQGEEQCDDGNLQAGDGCNASCGLEGGFRCPNPGRACEAICGDGLVLGRERCDDGNAAAGDGCSSQCQLEDGWACPRNNGACHKTVCGDGVTEGAEPCDRSDPATFDGCTPDCKLQPNCHSVGGWGPCSSKCGDGFSIAGDDEQCDDGNNRDGDGCSANCLVEDGYVCVKSAGATGNSLTLPVVYRDFKGKDLGGHPDFETNDYSKNGLKRGAVSSILPSDGKPTLVTPVPSDFPFSTSDNFEQWYHDDPSGCAGAACNKVVYDNLVLNRASAGQPFVFEKLGSFFPLDGKGWQDPSVAAADRESNHEGYAPGWINGNDWSLGPGQPQNTSLGEHNFSFTSELRYWFEYQGGESLEFYGDDDLWVYVDGQLVVDMGGFKREVIGKLLLDGGGSATVTYQNNLPWNQPPSVEGPTTVALGLQKGRVYEVALFHAEAQSQLSSYKLTLAGFEQQTWKCSAKCGDGKVVGNEACDAGAANADNTYGACTTSCTRGPYCGDGVRQAAFEACDDGANVTVAYDAQGCAPGCKLPPRCGDGVLDLGEECDDSSANQDGRYGGCSGRCTLNAFCGDGVVDASEECDDGQNTGGYGFCGVGCRLGDRCGDGVKQTGEQCDDGADNGRPGKCGTDCGLAARCGDGVVDVDAGETCDDGVNDGSYGKCAVDCTAGPRCGDGFAQTEFGEQCDYGDANADGAYGGCSTKCLLGPRCGDGSVQSPIEKCDDHNHESGDGCSSTCLKEEPVVR